VGVLEADFEDVGWLKLAQNHAQLYTWSYNNYVEPMGSGATVPFNSCYHLAFNMLFFCLLLYLRTYKRTKIYKLLSVTVWEEYILSSAYVEDDHWTQET
jgi:hypothetical protein